MTAAVTAARDERRGVRGGGLGSGTSDERRDRDNKEKDKESRRSSERDRSEHRYLQFNNVVYVLKCLSLFKKLKSNYVWGSLLFIVFIIFSSFWAVKKCKLNNFILVTFIYICC